MNYIQVQFNSQRRHSPHSSTESLASVYEQLLLSLSECCSSHHYTPRNEVIGGDIGLTMSVCRHYLCPLITPMLFVGFFKHSNIADERRIPFAMLYTYMKCGVLPDTGGRIDSQI